MTAEAFDRLLYTDCLPGSGRGAGGGFQVQAQSSGVDSAQAKLAVASLLYEVQVPWLNQRRPISEFPLGIAHAHGDGYGTGQGRYLGKEAAGGRDGNHLTDCLLTRNGDLYGAVRPAQLWQSPLWRESSWPDKDCPPLDMAELEPGPLTAEAVGDWARARPERGAVLARLLTVLEDPAGRRVVIVSDGADEAVTWIAAATLLLPSRLALDVSFKVFSTIPLRAEHRVVAAPAALFPQIAPGRGGSAFIVDARTCTADEGAVSERAAFFTGKFTGSGDPYDVVDAVELADALGDPRQHLGGQDAVTIGWTLTRPDQPAAKPAALFRWLSSARPELLAEHGPAAAELLLGAAANPEMLRWIDDAVATKRLAIEHAPVRLQLLAAELGEVRDGKGSVPVRQVLPAAPLDQGAHRDAESELSSAILLASDQQADRLLGLARRHGIAPDLAALQDRLDAFLGAWIARPDGFHPEDWAGRAEILDRAHDILHDRASANGPRSIKEAIRRLNRHFGDRGDLTDPLDCHIQASLIADRGSAGRQDRLHRLLSNIAADAKSAQRGPAAATEAAALQRALIEWNAVDGPVAVMVLTELPDSLGVEPVISARAAEELAAMSEKPTRKLLDLLDRLDRQGKAPSSRRLADLREADKHVHAFIEQARDERTRADVGYLESAVKELRQAAPRVIQARLDEVLGACLEARNPHLGGLVLTSLKPPLPRLLVERWGRTLGERDLVSDGVWCVTCLDNEDLSDMRYDQLATAVRDFGQALPKEKFDVWYAEVARRVEPHQRDLWESVFPQEAPRSRINLWRNRDGGRP
jgi:GTPase-associated protein 1, N-terminal domain type 2/GTPase-associated protein 1, middle domain